MVFLNMVCLTVAFAFYYGRIPGPGGKSKRIKLILVVIRVSLDIMAAYPCPVEKSGRGSSPHKA
jgi:hypothetical protein